MRYRHILRRLLPLPRLHPHRGRHPGPRHRRQFGHLQRHRGRPPQASALSRIREQLIGVWHRRPASTSRKLNIAPFLYFTYRDQNRTLQRCRRLEHGIVQRHRHWPSPSRSTASEVTDGVAAAARRAARPGPLVLAPGRFARQPRNRHPHRTATGSGASAATARPSAAPSRWTAGPRRSSA